MLSDDELDRLCEFVIDRLLSGETRPRIAARELVALMARNHPEVSALSALLPLTMAAAAMQGMLSGTAASALVAETWRTTALIGVEVLAMQAGPDAPEGVPDVAALHLWIARGDTALGGA